MSQHDVCTDPAILDQWNVVAAVEDIAEGVVNDATLLGERISFAKSPEGDCVVWRSDPAMPAGSRIEASAIADPLPSLSEYLYLWTCLGSPPAEIFAIPEFHEPDRRNIHAGTIGVHVSAPRAVENFLDMGHFPFVHTGVLGIEPHTEVAEYQVRTDPITNDIWATECIFYQPMAATTSTEGAMTDYQYRVPHPFCVLLYKSCPVDDQRMDVIGLFCRAVAPDYIKGSMFLSLLDDQNTDAEIRRFQQTIFAQDKPILENQNPKLLPLDPRAETPIRADKVAIAYRRWLSDLGVTYGVTPAA
jgi:phenylpropionate dioxygenase-like ring-hydroxylating dioxygenase large terminal subunit